MGPSSYISLWLLLCPLRSWQLFLAPTQDTSVGYCLILISLHLAHHVQYILPGFTFASLIRSLKLPLTTLLLMCVRPGGAPSLRQWRSSDAIALFIEELQLSSTRENIPRSILPFIVLLLGLIRPLRRSNNLISLSILCSLTKFEPQHNAINNESIFVPVSS